MKLMVFHGHHGYDKTQPFNLNFVVFELRNEKKVEDDDRGWRNGECIMK